MTECNHDLAERETACADGFCPICLRSQLAAANRISEQATERINKALEACDKATDKYKAQLAAAVEALKKAREIIVGWDGDATDIEAALAAVKEGKLLKAADEARKRVSGYSDEQRAELETRARAKIKEGK